MVDGWNHILMVRKSGNVYTYINGTLQDTKTLAGTEFRLVEDISIISGCPAVALIRVGTNADTSAAARFVQCSPITYDASSDGVVVEILPQDFHATMVRDRASGHIYECAITEGSASAYPDRLYGAGAPAVTPQFIGQEYYDQTNHLLYFATGRDSAINWDRYARASEIGGKQDTLIPGTTIKTINGVSPLGAGNIQIGEGGTGGGGGTVINVQDYGAVGNGLVDDTAAIHRALEVVRAAKGTIYFPFGTYLTRKGLVLEANMSVDADRGAVLKNASAFLSDDAGNPATGYCAVTTLTAGISAGAHTCTVDSTVGLAVGQQITIACVANPGVNPKPSYTDTHADITAIDGNTITFDTSRWTTNGADGGAVADCTVGGGFKTYLMTDFSLIETTYRDSRHITIKDITLMPCGNSSEPYIYTISAIHQTKQSSVSLQSDFRVIGVTIAGSVQDGISIQGESDAWVEDCMVFDVKFKGIHFGTSCQRVHVLNNYLYNCGASGSDDVVAANGGGGAIYWCVNNHHVSAINNRIDRCRRGCFGINYKGQGETDTDAIISSNFFEDCTVSAIEITGAPRMIVADNLIRGFTGDAIPIKVENYVSSGNVYHTIHPTIRGNTIGDFQNGYSNALGAIYVQGAVGAIIDGNNVQPNTSATGSAAIVLEGCQNSIAACNIAGAVDVSDGGNSGVIKANNVELGVSE